MVVADSVRWHTEPVRDGRLPFAAADRRSRQHASVSVSQQLFLVMNVKALESARQSRQLNHDTYFFDTKEDR